MGYFINADVVEAELKGQRYLDCNNYLSKELSQADWDDFILDYDMVARTGNEICPKVSITGNVLVAGGVVNSYPASVICEFFNFCTLTVQNTFKNALLRCKNSIFAQTRYKWTLYLNIPIN